MQMKVPYPNNTEDNTITIKSAVVNTFIHRMIWVNRSVHYVQSSVILLTEDCNK